ncbi:MAG: 3-dehydroquinate synthase [Rikenellaceae bacterium]
MNKVIEVKTDDIVSSVVVGKVEKELDNYLKGCKRVIVITDATVKGFYGSLIEKFEHIVIGQGEENKNLMALGAIYSSLLEFGADRHTTIVGIGGGIVTDITGFVASTYQRGVDFGFVATTLLSQVDASVGGKNGVNHDRFKNMIGLFSQPRFVICDAQMLSTLPLREFRAGISEIIKAGVIKSSLLFEKFEQNSLETFLTNRELLEEVIFESIKIKAAVVEQDETEKGERKKLNLGHTIGHAIEKSTSNFIHGEAVAIGMVLAAELGVKCGITPVSVLERVEKVVENFGFSLECGVDKDTLFEALKSDKKRNQESVDFILPTAIGEAKIVNFKFSELEKIFKEEF